MPKSKLIISLLFITAILLALFHNLAINLSWYYFYPMIDIPIHILGGFVIALFIYFISQTSQDSDYSQESSQYHLFFLMVFGTFLISVFWEALELIFYLTKDAGLSYETFSDIIFGIVGAGLAWGLIRLLPGKKTH